MGFQGRLGTQVAFPTVEVETCIRDALNAQADIQAVLRPKPPASWEPAIDSLAVIEIICSIEELIGIRLPASFAPRGGYDSMEACVNDLLAETQSVWIELNKEEQPHER